MCARLCERAGAGASVPYAVHHAHLQHVNNAVQEVVDDWDAQQRLEGSGKHLAVRPIHKHQLLHTLWVQRSKL